MSNSRYYLPTPLSKIDIIALKSSRKYITTISQNYNSGLFETFVTSIPFIGEHTHNQICVRVSASGQVCCWVEVFPDDDKFYLLCKDSQMLICKSILKQY